MRRGRHRRGVVGAIVSGWFLPSQPPSEPEAALARLTDSHGDLAVATIH